MGIQIKLKELIIGLDSNGGLAEILIEEMNRTNLSVNNPTPKGGLIKKPSYSFDRSGHLLEFILDGQLTITSAPGNYTTYDSTLGGNIIANPAQDIIRRQVKIGYDIARAGLKIVQNGTSTYKRLKEIDNARDAGLKAHGADGLDVTPIQPTSNLQGASGWQPLAAVLGSSWGYGRWNWMINPSLSNTTAIEYGTQIFLPINRRGRTQHTFTATIQLLRNQNLSHYVAEMALEVHKLNNPKECIFTGSAYENNCNPKDPLAGNQVRLCNHLRACEATLERIADEYCTNHP